MKYLKVTVVALTLIALIASATATFASGGGYGILIFDTTSSVYTGGGG